MFSKTGKKPFKQCVMQILALLGLLLLLWGSGLQSANANAGSVQRASSSSGGEQGNQNSSDADISSDGRYVVFASSASNLVSEDTNGYADVFVYDRETSETVRVSVDSNGMQADGFSAIAAISDNGRYVTFVSGATNLVSGDNNGLNDIFVRDLELGETTRVSVDSNGVETDDTNYSPRISSDGRYVIFTSPATNLVSEDLNGVRDVFVHDRETGETTRVSVDSNGVAGNEDSKAYSISSDGRYVAFSSRADNLISNDTNGEGDIFVHDRETGETTRVSVDSNGVEADNSSSSAEMSNDGRYVTFSSTATNLVSQDLNRKWDVFVHDRQTGETTRVSVASDGTEGNDISSDSSMSNDGRYISFQSSANNLVSNDTNEDKDIFIHDRNTGVTKRASLTGSGTQVNQAGRSPAISDDGRVVAFDSRATNLVVPDTNDAVDVYVVSDIEPINCDSLNSSGDGYTYPYTVGTVISDDHGADLKMALICADDNSSQTITLADNIVLTTIDNDDTLGDNGLPIIDSHIVIDGAGFTIARDLSYTLCDGSYGGYADFRFFYVAAAGALSLENITLENGCGKGDEPEDYGGAIYNSGSLIIKGSTLRNNTVNERAGAVFNGKDLTVVDSTFADNQAATWGGAILNGNTGTATISGSTLVDNEARLGGAIFNNKTLIVSNSTLVDNVASKHGGGLYNAANDSLDISFSTIANNSGLGLYDNGGTIALNASILANNSAGDCVHKNSLSGGHNLIQDADSACGLSDGSDGNLIGVDPQLRTLADNGGPTETSALETGSPAIDAAGADCPAADQRGTARPQGAACDIGAVEMVGLGGTAVNSIGIADGNLGLLATAGGALLIGLLGLLVWRRREE
ncbi:MAG: choice-of-anchor Q domain-containing protein [Chloroflexota bacterium]